MDDGCKGQWSEGDSKTAIGDTWRTSGLQRNRHSRGHDSAVARNVGPWGLDCLFCRCLKSNNLFTSQEGQSLWVWRGKPFQKEYNETFS